jgi:nitrilase
MRGAAVVDESDVPDDFPYKGKMNIRYARGGRSIIAPLGIPLVGPVEGAQILHAELQAWMIKAVKAIVDSTGHYSRPDVVRLIINNQAPSREPILHSRSLFESLPARVLADAADAQGVEASRVEGFLQSSLLAKPTSMADSAT